jgi:hypothetical protein
MADIGIDTSLPGEIATAVTGAVNFFDMVYSRVESVRKRNLSADNYLRAYYFEVVNNLEFLSVVDAKKFKAVEVNSDIFRKFIARLDTEIGSTILFTENIDEKSGLYRLLKAKGRIENRHQMLTTSNTGIEADFRGKILYENILQAISFTVVKIEVLRRLSSVESDEAEYLNRLSLEKRIVNIRERFAMIKNVMDKMDGIRELSR